MPTPRSHRRRGNNYVSDSVTQVGGNILIRYGTGSNDVEINGILAGQFDTPHIVNYVGGAGIDTVSVALTADTIQTFVLTANLGAGGDFFTLAAGNPLAKLLIDFGLGIDSFTSSFGVFTFPVFLLHLP